METCRPTLLSETHDGVTDILRTLTCLGICTTCHSEVSILVNDYNEIRKELMTFCREKMTILVFLVVQLDVVDPSSCEELVTFVHLNAERIEHLLSLLRLLDDCVLPLILLACSHRKNCKIVLKKSIIGCELHHLRVNEDKLEFRRMLGIQE